MTTRSYARDTTALTVIDLLNDLMAEDGELSNRIGPMVKKLNLVSGSSVFSMVRGPKGWRCSVHRTASTSTHSTTSGICSRASSSASTTTCSGRAATGLRPSPPTADPRSPTPPVKPLR